MMPLFEFPESHHKFPLAVYFPHANVWFHDPLSMHPTFTKVLRVSKGGLFKSHLQGFSPFITQTPNLTTPLTSHPFWQIASHQEGQGRKGTRKAQGVLLC